MFIVLISSIIYITGVVAILGGTFIGIFIHKTAQIKSENSFNNTTDSDVVFAPEFTWRILNMWSWFVITVLCVLGHLVVFLVTLHLYKFHIMLWKKGLSTYSYITNLRSNNQINHETTTQTINSQTNQSNKNRSKLTNAVSDLSTIQLPPVIPPKNYQNQERHISSSPS